LLEEAEPMMWVLKPQSRFGYSQWSSYSTDPVYTHLGTFKCYMMVDLYKICPSLHGNFKQK